MKKIYYNKLIRDKIPEKICALGSECETHELSQIEFEKELIRKVSEEASGLLNAKDHQEFLKELADVMDVLDEVMKVKNVSRAQLSEQQERNFEKKADLKRSFFLSGHLMTNIGQMKPMERLNMINNFGILV